MKTKQFIICGFLAVMFALTFAACDEGGETVYDPAGLWEFTIDGRTVTVLIADNNWTGNFEGFTISGTFTRSGNVLTLKTDDGQTVGTATLTGNTSVELTLNDSTGMEGTYTGTKLPLEQLPELTITNFRGNPGLRSDKWSTGTARFYRSGELVWLLFIQHDYGFEVPTTGNSITINVYNAKNGNSFQTYVPGYGGVGLEKTTPFIGNVTVDAGNLSITQWEENVDAAFYVNKVPITFTNGKATINFEQQMVLDDIW